MNPELLFDVRLLERNVTRGRVKPAELDAHLQSLPDASANAANLVESLADRGQAPASAAPAAPAAKAPGGKKPAK